MAPEVTGMAFCPAPCTGAQLHASFLSELADTPPEDHSAALNILFLYVENFLKTSVYMSTLPRSLSMEFPLFSLNFLKSDSQSVRCISDSVLPSRVL